MKQYHKIQTVFLRDPETNFKKLLIGQWAKPEFEYLRLNEWQFTEKVDGTNIRVIFDGVETLTFKGKSDNAQMPPFLETTLARMFVPQIPVFQELFPEGVCLYGEGYGARIQKGGGNYRADQSFVLFDAKIGNWWLNRGSLMEISDKLELEIVPIIGSGTLWDMVGMVEAGFDSVWGDFQAEGIVARPAVQMLSRGGERIITKLKTRDFQYKG